MTDYRKWQVMLLVYLACGVEFTRVLFMGGPNSVPMPMWIATTAVIWALLPFVVMYMRRAKAKQ